MYILKRINYFIIIIIIIIKPAKLSVCLLPVAIAKWKWLET